MPLTKKQLQKIEELIEERFLAFTYRSLGKRALTEAEIERLKRKGLLRGTTRHLTADAYTLGKVVALVERGRTRGLSFEDTLKITKKMTPRTGVEKKAIEFATDHAGVYIKGLKDSMVRDTRALAARGSGAALRAVREDVSEALANRETISELKTTLFGTFDDRYRDWQRVAHTEINTAIQQGIYHEIKEKSDDGAGQLVFKRPNPDACKYCKKVYLQDDEVTPKVFKLEHLEETNVGRRAADWGPVIGSVHPWCNCQLQVVPEGYSFVKKKTVKEPFKSRGRDYGLGEIIEDPGSLTESQRGKLRESAILSFTGTTAEPIRKAEVSKMLSEKSCNH